MQKPLYFENEGQLVAGTLHLPDGPGPHPGVIFCHGFTGNKGETHFLFVKASRELEAHGIASLRFDFRGSGESDGEFCDMTALTEISDARRAFHVLAEQPEVDAARLGVVGLSLGGMVAACVAGREPGVKSTVLWAAVADMGLMSKLFISENHSLLETQGWVDIGGLKLGAGFFRDTAKVDPVAEIAASKSPVFIIHGEADTAVPVSHAEKYFAALRKPTRKVSKLILHGSDHTFNRVAWEAEAISATALWLEKTL